MATTVARQPVLAVARDEHETVVLEPRRLPAAPVAHGDGRPLGERAHRRVHLVARAGGGAPPLSPPGRARRAPAPRATRLFWSWSLELAASRARRRRPPCVQLMSRSKSGKRRNIPPGPSSAEIDRVLDPEPAEAVARPAGRPARSRRRRPGSRPAERRRAAAQLHRFESRSRRASAWSMRSITGGWSSRNCSSCGPGSDEAAEQRLGSDVGARRPAGQREISPK